MIYQDMFIVWFVPYKSIPKNRPRAPTVSYGMLRILFVAHNIQYPACRRDIPRSVSRKT